jgi:hypothetical protein
MPAWDAAARVTCPCHGRQKGHRKPRRRLSWCEQPDHHDLGDLPETHAAVAETLRDLVERYRYEELDAALGAEAGRAPPGSPSIPRGSAPCGRREGDQLIRERSTK